MVKSLWVDQKCARTQSVQQNTIILCALGFVASTITLNNAERTIASSIDSDDVLGYVTLTRVAPIIEKDARKCVAELPLLLCQRKIS